MKKIYLLLLLASLCLWNGVSAQTIEQSDRQNLVSVVGTNSFGVMEVNTGKLVVDSIYQSVEIYEGPVIYCASDIFRVNGVLYRLPAMVVDIYRADGCLVAHNFEALIQADKVPYTATIDFAKAKGYKDLESYAKFLIGIDYEKQGLRREAYQYYVRAYRLNPDFTIAKTYADAVVAGMKEEQRQELARIRMEDLQAEIAAAEFQARCNAIAAGLNAMGESLAQVASQSGTPLQSASTPKASKTKTAQQQEKCLGTVKAYGIGEGFGMNVEHSQTFQLYQDDRGYYIMDTKYSRAKLYLGSNTRDKFGEYSVSMYNYSTITTNGVHWYFKL